MPREEDLFVIARAKLVLMRMELLSQFKQFAPDELTFSAVTNDWSALKIAYHIYLAEDLLLQRTRQIQEEENPQIAAIGVEHSRLVHENGHLLPFVTVLEGLAVRREALLRYLADLPVGAWERPFRHNLRGEMHFEQWIHMLPEHDQKHIQQLADLKTTITQMRS